MESTITDRPRPIVSHVTERGLIVELIYRAHENRTVFAVGQDAASRIVDRLTLPDGQLLVPYAASNNLIRSGCVLFPSDVEPYRGTNDLVEEIREYLDRYVTLNEEMRQIAPWYVLFSWVSDAFNEVPYLRFRGDYGTGKTRTLLVLGSIMYKPIFASAASTPSPIFHLLDSFGGTLILDEADFRLSDERADIVKILNNGSVRGVPVLRTIVTKDREFNPRAFNVFGPKIVAMRKEYDDRALESRFITSETDHTSPSGGVPINLPEAQKHEALLLRNKFLAFRFKERNRVHVLVDADFHGNLRLRQSIVPLLSIIEDAAERVRVRDAVLGLFVPPAMTVSERLDLDMVATLVDCLADEPSKSLAIGTVTERFNTTHQHQPFCPVTPKWVGSFIRQRLRLITHKSNGTYVIPPSEHSKILALAERFALRIEPHT